MEQQRFELENPKLLNPLTLAFMGDVVYEIFVREHIIRQFGSLSAGKLHTLTVKLVRASYQAAVYDAIEPILTEEELSILKRGRNSNSVCCPKNSNISEYRKATGVESLFGYLHLNKETDRLEELFSIVLSLMPKE